MTERMRAFKERLRKNNAATIGQYMGYEREETKLDLCNKFIEKLAGLLGDKYEMVASCNKDASRYLVPVGTRDQITWYGKPANSFRVSDHWSWFTNTKNCSIRNYIQCYSRDMPVPKPRPHNDPDGATKAVRGTAVAVQATDGTYRCVYGDKYDRVRHRWSWVESDPLEVIAQLGL